jgi:nicotinate-nucleotide adenylyltransferase
VKLAIFGGTFDPIHSAHLTVAREALEVCALDRILFVPAANPPHKSGATGASYEHRFRMVELACEGAPRFVASRLEEGTARSYSIDTIEKVRATLAFEDELFFLIGADAFAEITTWRRWQDVIGLVTFLVVTRPGHGYSVPTGARVVSLETVALPVSSSDIRADLAAGGAPEELPTAVLDYVRANNLDRN